MNPRPSKYFLLVVLSLLAMKCGAQQSTSVQAATPNPTPTAKPIAKGSTQPVPPDDTSNSNPPAAASQTQVTAMQKQIDSIEDSLKKPDSDFAVTIGVGSLILNQGVTDYSNSSNILQSNNLGRATPQYLLGVSMRTAVPNFAHLGANVDRDVDHCKGDNLRSKCELWRRRPWEGFVSLKFAPQSSQTINGYVIGGSYAIARYLDALIGYALSPVNEPAPGFRVSASQFVTAQQMQGLDVNFNPAAMLQNAQNAFDGFPLTDSTGKLIYKGNALTVHYRGGVIFGVSIPFAFSSIFGGGSKGQAALPTDQPKANGSSPVSK